MVKGEEGAGADARGADAGPRRAGAAAAGVTRDGERVGAGQEVRGDDKVMEGVCRVWSGCQDLATIWVVEPQCGVTEATTNPQQPAVAASGGRHTRPPSRRRSRQASLRSGMVERTRHCIHQVCSLPISVLYVQPQEVTQLSPRHRET